MPGMQENDKESIPGGEKVRPGNFGPVPGGSIILWQSDHFIIYIDSHGKVWRYMHEFHARWSADFGNIKIPEPVNIETPRKLTKEEIEDLL
jgi:hypothetical protein